MGHTEDIRKLADTERVGSHEADDPPTGWIGKGAVKCNGIVHNEINRNEIYHCVNPPGFFPYATFLRR